MPRNETVERELFKFDELDDNAKETARNWYRGCIESDELSDSDDWQAVAAILGIEFDTYSVKTMGGDTRRKAKVYWSGFWSQGDGASWHGWYAYAKQAPKRIREYAPDDTELHRIADGLQAAQSRYFYQLRANVTAGHLSNHYSHSGTMAVDVTDNRDQWRAIDESTVDDVTRLLRDFADWIYKQLQAQWDWLNSDECIDENIRINEYEFTESGDIA